MKRQVTETVSYAVCVDCINFIANDELSEDLSFARQRDIAHGSIGMMVGDKDFGFCYGFCECCHDETFGDRFEAVTIA